MVVYRYFIIANKTPTFEFRLNQRTVIYVVRNKPCPEKPTMTGLAHARDIVVVAHGDFDFSPSVGG